MQLHNFVIEALEQVMAWELPAEACPDALTSQAALMAGMDPEQVGGSDLD